MSANVDSRSALALYGGSAVRDTLLPYGRQSVKQDDLEAVVRVLTSDYLTTGPEVEAFERDVREFVGAREAVAVANGTAALHAAMYAAGVGPGDEVIVPAITFAATANAAIFLGATPVIVDVLPGTLLIDPEAVRQAMTPQTKAIVPVDYAGQPCDYDTIRDLAGPNITIIADACHSLGASRAGKTVGTLADLTCFSFHPVKAITTGEGGMVVTNNLESAKKMRQFRNHGIDRDARGREKQNTWEYAMVDLGYNYRLTDLQCALGRVQLTRLSSWLERRRDIAAQYDKAFADMPEVTPLAVEERVEHGYHIYVVQFDLKRLQTDRGELFRALRAENIGVNVHYRPVHLHPFYKEQFGYAAGRCPVAEGAYDEMITLPLFPEMSDEDVENVIEAVRKVVLAFRTAELKTKPHKDQGATV